ncbi:hypothetical protein OLMES_2619 [Oleiphilus messinensis]|uniref:PH domain-containing protein n=1 Tax=Oleiphilus messinensis TaxID=141451 RepID=A0A1Y0I911_9GAMM|nr:hypothetical protein [Oleiphilus messinensis]ARU56669.1 hypothetical protein OLMES_2619 [Oleiphilus messinensis]
MKGLLSVIDERENANKRHFIALVSKLITLTREGKLEWIPCNRNSLPKTLHQVTSAFTTTYQSRTVLIYEELVRFDRDPINHRLLAALAASSGDGYKHVVIELINDDGLTLFRFPQFNINNSLLIEVQHQTSEVDDWMEALLNETSSIKSDLN